MATLPNLSRRNLQPELMDQPGLDEQQHRRALRALARINWFSRSAAILWPELKRHARLAAEEPLRVLDLACGSGDVTLALARRAQRAGLPIRFSGCDVSPVAVQAAQARAERAQVSVDFFVCDVLGTPLAKGYDVMMCSLFLHHLTESQAVGLLRTMAQARRALLVNDLLRTRLGYMLAYAGTRLLTRSPIVHFDGPQSVAGAFTLEEVAELAQRAGLERIRLVRRWPQRFLLSWSPP